MQSQPLPDKIIRFNEAIARTGLSRSTIDSLIRKDAFPHKIKLSERAAGFIEAEVNDWLKSKQVRA